MGEGREEGLCLDTGFRGILLAYCNPSTSAYQKYTLSKNGDFSILS